jgi:MoaA/NifB/PqqE/SkfB family radical SAM enzyme
VDAVRAEFEDRTAGLAVPVYAWPIAAMTWVRIMPLGAASELIVYCLGDCKALLRRPDGSVQDLDPWTNSQEAVVQDAIAALVRELGITLWSVFLVVPTGRARPGDLLAADEVEALLHRLHDLSLDAPFDVKTTAAPHYRRVALQRRTAARRAGGDDAPAAPAIGFTLADHIGRARGVNDGNGFAFVSHTGDVYPSGFLPLSAGNVRTHDLLELYRTSGLFRALRDPDALRGKCGASEFRRVCGGSRARAYALTGDVLAADPSCAYIPPAWARRHASGATA